MTTILQMSTKYQDRSVGADGEGDGSGGLDPAIHKLPPVPLTLLLLQ